MMRKKYSIIFKIAILAILLAAVAFLFKDSSDTQRPTPYDVAMPTPKKFAELKKWIAADADFVAVVDFHRLAKTPLSRFLEERLLSRGDKTIVDAVFGPNNAIGMAALAVNFGKDQGPLSAIVTIQAELKEPDFIDKIRQELANENVKLSSELVEGVFVYWEEESEDPFAMALPGPHHLLIGSKSAIVSLLERPPEGSGHLPLPEPDSPFFGALRTSERMKRLFPRQIASVQFAQFASDDAMQLHIGVECADEDQANDLRMFLSGMKALYALQGDGNEVLQNAIDTVVIRGEGNVVQIDAPLEQLPSLFSKQ